MNIHIYKTSGCGHCVKISELMSRADLEYTSTLVGRDITKTEFLSKYPEAPGFPYVIINDTPIGGLVETVKYFVENGLVSSRKK
jgi:glutaredoxin